jgi:hypothetical protein
VGRSVVTGGIRRGAMLGKGREASGEDILNVRGNNLFSTKEVWIRGRCEILQGRGL